MPRRTYDYPRDARGNRIGIRRNVMVATKAQIIKKLMNSIMCLYDLRGAHARHYHLPFDPTDYKWDKIPGSPDIASYLLKRGMFMTQVLTRVWLERHFPGSTFTKQYKERHVWKLLKGVAACLGFKPILRRVQLRLYDEPMLQSEPSRKGNPARVVLPGLFFAPVFDRETIHNLEFKICVMRYRRSRSFNVAKVLELTTEDELIKECGPAPRGVTMKAPFTHRNGDSVPFTLP